MAEEKKDTAENKTEPAKAENVSASSAVMSLLCSIAVGLCWLFRNFEFRHKITGPGGAEQAQRSFLVMDVNVGLRRAMLIFAIIGLLIGLKAVSKRCKFLDFTAFIIAVVVGLAVGYIVYQMGGKGFWFGGQ